jgi:hypothetical protein
MAAATISAYNGFGDLLVKAANWSTLPPIKCRLHTSSYTFAATHNVLADLSAEVGTTNTGYTAGGVMLANVSYLRTTNVVKIDADDAVWTAGSAGLTARWAILHYSGTIDSLTDPLMLAVLLDSAPADVSAPATQEFRVAWNAGGIFTLTV